MRTIRAIISAFFIDVAAFNVKRDRRRVPARRHASEGDLSNRTDGSDHLDLGRSSAGSAFRSSGRRAGCAPARPAKRRSDGSSMT
jgi:hypothetical protein